MTTDIHDPLTSQDQHYPPCATSSLEILQIITITIIVTIIIPHFITRILDILKPPRSCDTKSKQEIYAVISVIKDQNKILGGQLELLRGGRYNRMLRRCKALNDVFYEKWLKPSLGQPDQSCESSSDDDDTRAAKHKKRLEALKKEPESKILELLHKDLNLTYRITDRKRRSQELGDALIYIITIVDEYNSLQQPDQRSSLPICKILHNLYDPLNKFNFLTESYRSPQYTWDEVACVMLGDKDIFAQFCLRLHNYHTIVYFFKEHHQLIFVDEWLNGLLDRLVEYLPYDFMNELLRSVRDENERTRMFVAKKDEVGAYVKLYVNRSDDLYRLLSIRDTINGQIALQVNAAWFFTLLADIYNPGQRDLFIKLLSITDNHNRTALQLPTSPFPNSLNNFDFSTESIRSKQFNRDELFCAMLGDKHILAETFPRPNNNAIVHFFTRYPQLLFINEWSSRLIDQLVKYLSRDNMDKVLTSVRDENEQTRMFVAKKNEVGTYLKLYVNRSDDLYRLLFIRDTINGQIALHVNAAAWFFSLLADIYNPRQRDLFIKLLSITDNHNRTALQLSTSLFPNYMNNFDFSTESIRSEQFNWDELFCAMLGDKHIFAKIFSKLNNNAIVHFFTGYFQLLFINEWSSRLIDEMVKYLSRDNMDKVLTSVRDEIGQTRMFLATGNEMYIYMKLYMNHADHLYKLLSIPNTNGQTALHVNAGCITELLAATYTPQQRVMFIKFIDNLYETTALRSLNCESLSSLIRRVEHKEYVTHTHHTNILILYDTNDEPETEQEALTIDNACRSKFNTYNITLEKDKTREEIINLLKRTANKETCADRLPTSLIVITLSRGGVRTIDDCNGTPIKLSEMEEAMCSDVLDGKPKLLITAYRQRETDINDARPYYVPTHGHFCAVMSCASGQSSTRGVFTGKLAEQIKNSTKNTNIFKVVNNVSDEMEREGHKQTPMIMTTLKAEYCPTDDWRS